MDDYIRLHILSFIKPDTDYSKCIIDKNIKTIEKYRKVKYDNDIIQEKLYNIFSPYFYLEHIERDDADIELLKKIVNNIFIAQYGFRYQYNDFLDKPTMFRLLKDFDDNSIHKKTENFCYYGVCGKSKFLL